MCCGRLEACEDVAGGLVKAKLLLAGVRKLCPLIKHVLYSVDVGSGHLKNAVRNGSFLDEKLQVQTVGIFAQH